MPMISVKRTAEEVKVDNEPALMSGDEYPWGLQVDLDDDTLEKLDQGLLDVGTELKLDAIVNVSAVHEHSNEGGRSRSMTLQITELALTRPAREASERLYPEED
jgi:hypothetical protein